MPAQGGPALRLEYDVVGNLSHSGQSAALSQESIRPLRIPALSTVELGLALAQALDLAEGKQIGHTYRLTYIAVSIARHLGLPAETIAAVFHASLFHDVGAAAATADLCRVVGLSEEALTGALPLKTPEELGLELSFADVGAVVDALYRHPRVGAQVASELELPDGVAEAIAAHHERWDGLGFPEGLSEREIPPAARILAAADLIEALISAEPSGLVARRNLIAGLGPHEGSSLDPEVAAAARELARTDEFWLGLFDERLPSTLANLCPVPDEKRNRRRALRFAEAMADLADAKRGASPRHARRTAEWAGKLALAAGYDRGHAEVIELAALLADIGLLGIPARILAKPDILTVTEMQVMRRHPGYSQMVLEAIPGLEEVALWVGRHHERPDGKGYPEMLGHGDIPKEAAIIAVADTFVALTSERPYRKALSVDDAKQVLAGAAGTQLDADLVETFLTLV